MSATVPKASDAPSIRNPSGPQWFTPAPFVSVKTSAAGSWQPNTLPPQSAVNRSFDGRGTSFVLTFLCPCTLTVVLTFFAGTFTTSTVMLAEPLVPNVWFCQVPVQWPATADGVNAAVGPWIIPVKRGERAPLTPCFFAFLTALHLPRVSP